MNFKQSVEVWTTLGKVDPLWAILSDPEKENGKWDEAEFFESGKQEIGTALSTIEKMGFEVNFGAALDFGCGVGRLTQALGERFREVHGVDVAETMIEGARRYDRSGGTCTFHVNTQPDLRLFESDRFDFIYSRIVLQHIPPENTKQYVAEFMRILKPGGLLAFQLPGELAQENPRAHPFHAEIVPPAGVLSLRARKAHRLRVTVKNTSEVTWVSGGEDGEVGRFRLGNHWLLKDGGMLQFDDGRASIPKDVAPGESCEMELTVRAPDYGDDYLLELDMVQEGNSWFKDYGPQSVQLRVHVSGPSRWLVELPRRIVRKLKRIMNRLRPDRGRQEEKPAFSMNAVPKDEVVQLIKDNGGSVSKLCEDFSAGPAWVSYFYYITKP